MPFNLDAALPLAARWNALQTGVTCVSQHTILVKMSIRQMCKTCVTLHWSMLTWLHLRQPSRVLPDKSRSIEMNLPHSNITGKAGRFQSFSPPGALHGILLSCCGLQLTVRVIAAAIMHVRDAELLQSARCLPTARGLVQPL